MPQVESIASFEHDGPRRFGDRFFVSKTVADQLIKRGLVMIPAENRPQMVDGVRSSASPAARASEQTTSKSSGRGVKPKREKVSAP